MTDPHRPGPHGPDDRLDEQLSRLLSDAVSDVEPGDALDSIRNRTKVTPMSARRPWLFAAGGAVVATAAVITAIALAGGNLTGASDDTGPVDTTSQSPDRGKDESDSPSPSPSPSETEPPASAQTVPVYFVGDTPSGLRLYREFQEVTTSDAATTAVELAVTGSAQDPDYSTTWPDGTGVAEVSYNGDVITVDLTGAERTRPDGVSEEQAAIAVEQVIYTAQAALQQGRPGVQLLLDGQRTDQVLGVPTAEPLANGPVLQTLALVSISSPSEGETVSGGTLEVSGVANSFEANVIVRIQRWEGTEVVLQEPITAEGWMGEQLFPFEGTLDLSDVPPGEYLLIASTDDPSGGAEGPGPHIDTRRIVVE
jgi:hypothetical protein